ncbi:MAG TPA: cytochrome b/b6 domain-containing protein [Pseudomonadota bacterium]|nr:cytochrome b/b6 domain-containing protein [Pseudomonadota bacterium]
MNARAVIVWDLPTRAFHGLLLLLVGAQYASGEFGWFDLQWHLYAGYATLALLLFRIVWGFIGSDSARFSAFLRGPATIFAYLRGTHAEAATHNPLGGWSVLLMMTVLLAMSLAGLASSDDIDVFGPLVATLDEASVRFATRWHHRLADALLWLIALHVAAVLWQEWRGSRLVGAMLHGRRTLDAAAPRIVSNTRAVVVLLLSAAAIYALLYWASR